VDGTEQGPGDGGDKDAGPGAAGFVRGGVGDHGAEDENTLVAEIYAAGAFGQAFAEADEEEGCGDAQGAGDHGDENGADGVHDDLAP